MKKVLAVGLGGMLGALLRAGFYEAFSSNNGLWLVNLIGSFTIGYAAARFQDESAEFRLFFSTGLIGSFTTFSAFSAEWFRTLESNIFAGIFFAVFMTACSAAFAAAGLWTGRKVGAK